jgi:hypothetical protein
MEMFSILYITWYPGLSKLNKLYTEDLYISIN